MNTTPHTDIINRVAQAIPLESLADFAFGRVRDSHFTGSSSDARDYASAAASVYAEVMQMLNDWAGEEAVAEWLTNDWYACDGDIRNDLDGLLTEFGYHDLATEWIKYLDHRMETI
jgi:hypothetical protein